MRRAWASMVLTGLVLAMLPGAATASSVNIIKVGPGGWSGSTQTMDTVAGWGCDAWAVTVPGGTTLTTLTVTVSDCRIVGDSFVVYVDGRATGVTPVVPFGGPTLSSGTFTTVLHRIRTTGHLVTIRDVGAVVHQNRGHTMIPAGYSVSVSYHN